MTTEQKQNLIKAAKEALNNPYPKGAEIVYSAAVLSKEGNIYSAAQYYSDTYSLTLHGEQSALAHAGAHGEGDIVAIAVASSEKLEKGQFTYSCNMCKQLLYENSKRSGLPIEVIFVNSFDETQEVNLSDMISYPWPK